MVYLQKSPCQRLNPDDFLADQVNFSSELANQILTVTHIDLVQQQKSPCSSLSIKTPSSTVRLLPFNTVRLSKWPNTAFGFGLIHLPAGYGGFTISVQPLLQPFNPHFPPTIRCRFCRPRHPWRFVCELFRSVYMWVEQCY